MPLASAPCLPRIADAELAAASLLRFQNQLNLERAGWPAFLAVVCGKGYGYRRPDGIAVVPVGL